MTRWHTIVMLPEEFQVLNAEVQFHPELQVRLNNHPVGEFELRLAEISLYCDVALDGVYDGDQQKQLARILANRLYSMRPETHTEIEVIRNLH